MNMDILNAFSLSIEVILSSCFQSFDVVHYDNDLYNVKSNLNFWNKSIHSQCVIYKLLDSAQ